ncbi:MAG: DUF4439 domain-containing protein [Nostocoides sp.]
MPPASSAAGDRIPSRRHVLAGMGTLGGALLLPRLAACGVQLEEGAPRIPFMPTRTPIPGEAALLALAGDTEATAQVCRSSTSPVASALVAIHENQADVLAALMGSAGVPGSLIPATGAPPTSAPKAVEDVAAAEGTALTLLPRLALAPTSIRPTLVAILAQRAAAAQILSGVAAVIPPPSQAPQWPPSSAAVFLQATRSAIYGFEVVAAQGDAATAKASGRALDRLNALVSEQQARLERHQLPVQPGYVLPFPVATPAAATRLGRQIAAGLLTAYGTRLTPDDPANTGATMPDQVSWMGQAQLLAYAWASPLAAFPGMSEPVGQGDTRATAQEPQT